MHKALLLPHVSFSSSHWCFERRVPDKAALAEVAIMRVTSFSMHNSRSLPSYGWTSSRVQWVVHQCRPHKLLL